MRDHHYEDSFFKVPNFAQSIPEFAKLNWDFQITHEHLACTFGASSCILFLKRIHPHIAPDDTFSCSDVLMIVR
jgi:hypothetical protein